MKRIFTSVPWIHHTFTDARLYSPFTFTHLFSQRCECVSLTVTFLIFAAIYLVSVHLSSHMPNMKDGCCSSCWAGEFHTCSRLLNMSTFVVVATCHHTSKRVFLSFLSQEVMPSTYCVNVTLITPIIKAKDLSKVLFLNSDAAGRKHHKQHNSLFVALNFKELCSVWIIRQKNALCARYVRWTYQEKKIWNYNFSFYDKILPTHVSVAEESSQLA